MHPNEGNFFPFLSVPTTQVVREIDLVCPRWWIERGSNGFLLTELTIGFLVWPNFLSGKDGTEPLDCISKGER